MPSQMELIGNGKIIEGGSVSDTTLLLEKKSGKRFFHKAHSG